MALNVSMIMKVNEMELVAVGEVLNLNNPGNIIYNIEEILTHLYYLRMDMHQLGN